MKKLLLGFSCLIVAGGMASISPSQGREVRAEGGTNFKQDIVFNWDGEEFSQAKDGGTNIYRYDANGQKEVVARLKLSSEYKYANMSTPNIYDEPTGVAQGFSYAKHSSANRLRGPVYTIDKADYKYLACIPADQSLTVSYWVKNTNQDSNRWANETAKGTLCGNYEGIFSFRSKSITSGELVGLDLGIGGIYYYSEKAEDDTQKGNISIQQFLTPSTPKRKADRVENGNAQFMSVDWEMITYVFDKDNGFSVYKDGTKMANYTGKTTLLSNTGSNISVDKYRNLLATMLNNPDTEFCIHRGFNYKDEYGQAYRIDIGIDDMNVFNRGLSETEVKEFYDSYGTLNYMDKTNVKAAYHDLICNKCFTLKPNSTQHKSYGEILSKTEGEAKYKWYRWTEDENLQKAVKIDELKISSTPKNVYLDWQNESTKVTDGGIFAANSFVDTNMHMTDYSESKGWCNDKEHHYYDTAKSAYNSMGDEGRFAFQMDSAFANAKARLDAWATANGDVFDSKSNQYTKNEMKLGSLPLPVSDYDFPALLAISMVAMGLLAGFIIANRKRILRK